MTENDSRSQAGRAVSTGEADDDVETWPSLVAVCGLPGVGKSTVAEYLTDQLNATRIRTDEVRQDLFEDPQYTSEEKATVYQTIRDRAREALDAGETVVLDATFARQHRRDSIRELAADCDVTFCFVRVTCDQSTAEQRIATREGISDADIEVYRKYRREVFEPVKLEHVTVDNSGSLAEMRKRVDDLF